MPLIDANDVYQMTNVGDHIDATDVYNSNRNLLDNPFFTVRQRGNGPFTGAGFTVDRWSISGATSTLTGNSGYISLNMLANAVFLQRIATELELGKEYTASIMESDGTIYSATFTPSAAENIFQIGPYTGVFDARSTYAPNYRFYIYKAAAWTADIKAMKLEIGPNSTLANDAPPDYGTELAKCRYYFRRISASSLSAVDVAFVSATTRADVVNAGHSVPMRTTPTVAYSGTVNVYNGGTNHGVTGVSVIGYDTGFNLAFTSSGLTANSIGFISLNGTIDLSADL